MSSSQWFVLAIIFMVVVVPSWLSIHYGKDKKKKSESSFFDDGSTEVDVNIEELEDLQSMAKDLNKRIANLESILDAESPQWRTKYGQS